MITDYSQEKDDDTSAYIRGNSENTEHIKTCREQHFYQKIYLQYCVKPLLQYISFFYVDTAPWCLAKYVATVIDFNVKCINVSGRGEQIVWTGVLLFNFAQYKHSSSVTTRLIICCINTFSFYNTVKIKVWGYWQHISTIVNEETCYPTSACHVSKSNTNNTLFSGCMKIIILQFFHFK